MLDIRWIRENIDLVAKGALDKRMAFDLQGVLALDAEIRPLQARVEELQAERNNLSRLVPKAKPEERKGLIEAVSKIKDELDQLAPELTSKQAHLTSLLLTAPQPARADVPIGKDDSENVELRKIGVPTKFTFDPKSHIELGAALSIIDFERGVKLSGSRSYLFKGKGALLEQALLRWGYDFVLSLGYSPVSVPVLVNEQAMEGTGYFPHGRDQAYYVERDKMALVGTAEVPLCSMYADEILDEKELPIRLMALSTCFRREAGTYGKDTKGLYRVHQFQKIEMVVLAENSEESSEKLHSELLDAAEKLLLALGLPYRVVYVCTGDLGQGQVRKHDIETWMPSRGDYGETHSCSSFFEFQARRLGIRYRKAGEKEKSFVHTLNNTAIAAPRLILAILENFQNEDGSITIPPVLVPYMNGLEQITSPS